MQDFDVVIVGAGIVGQTLAAALDGTGQSVAIVERSRPQAPGAQWHFNTGGEVQLDARVSALTHASRRILERLGAWQRIPRSRVCHYQEMEVWDGDGLGHIHFSAAEIHEDSLGAIVENRFIAGALGRALDEKAHVTWMAPDSLEALQTDTAGHRTLELSSGERLRARLVVGADGAESRFRELAGFGVREWDYGHHAIACTVRTELPHANTAWQRFAAEGPLAFLPLSTEQKEEHYCSIVWSCVPEQADELMALDDDYFCKALSSALEHRLGQVLFADKRVCFPLKQRHALQYVQPGLALIGDAAHTIHPLAGQGVNLGMLDAAVLAEELLRGQRRGLAMHDESVLRRYQRRRMGHNLAAMGAMEGFKRLFAAQAPPLRWLRGTGMDLLSGLQLPKQALIRQACGLDGDLPALASREVAQVSSTSV